MHAVDELLWRLLPKWVITQRRMLYVTVHGGHAGALVRKQSLLWLGHEGTEEVAYAYRVGDDASYVKLSVVKVRQLLHLTVPFVLLNEPLDAPQEGLEVAHLDFLEALHCFLKDYAQLSRLGL